MLLVLLCFAQFLSSLKVYLESKILFLYSDDGHLYGAWSSSLGSSTCLVASRSGIPFGIIGYRVNGIACPIILYVLVVPSH